MFIPYYSPHITFFKIIKALFVSNAEKKVINYFQELTGKKHVLLTSSCRSAMYLTYKSLKHIKKVITSPLTCTMALNPIIEAGKELHYCDIDKNTLVMDSNLLPTCSGDNIAVQVIHLGGYPADVEEIKRKGYFVVEDCAQALGSKRNNKSVGFFGDIACFSLMKMGYGIGGGVLVTDDDFIYSSASSEQEEWVRFKRNTLLFRIIRMWLESNQRCSPIRFLLQKFLGLTEKKRSIGREDFSNIAKKPSSFFYKMFSIQIDCLEDLHKKRKEKHMDLIRRIQSPKWVVQKAENKDNVVMTTGKYFLYNDQHSSQEMLNYLLKNHIDAKHLEQRNVARVQKRLDLDLTYNSHLDRENLSVYLSIHDHLISLPLRENLSDREIDYLANLLLKETK